MRMALGLLPILIVGVLFGRPAYADVVTLDDTARGSYNQTGASNSTGGGTHTGNYFTGTLDGNEYRSFFIFDLSGVTGTVTSALLELSLVDGGAGPPAGVTLDIWDVTTLIPSLVAGNAGVSAWTDLGSGALLGFDHGVATEDFFDHTFVALDEDALADINGDLGQSFALGGALADPSGNEYLFLGSQLAPIAQLVLTTETVPEPSTIVLFGAGLVGLVGLRFSRRRRA